MMTKIKKIIIALLFGSVALAAPLIYNYNKIPDDLKLKCHKDKILFSSDIGNEKKKYLYVSDVRIFSVAGEDVSKRTGNVRFFKKAGKNKWEGKFYSGRPFYNDNNKWYQTETAITTIEAFEKQTKATMFEKISGLIVKEVVADSASYFSGAGDGYVYKYWTSWDAAHDAVTGYNSDYTSSSFFSLCEKTPSGYPQIHRGFVPIDTSELPDDAVISAATVYLYREYSYNCDNDGDDWVNIVGETTQASFTTLSTADYDQCGSVNNPIEGSTRRDISTLSSDGYKSFALNATGRDWISLTGYSAFGVREGHDCLDHAIGCITNEANGVQWRSSEFTGTSKDPYISITYTTGGAPERRIIKIE